MCCPSLHIVTICSIFVQYMCVAHFFLGDIIGQSKIVRVKLAV